MAIQINVVHGSEFAKADDRERAMSAAVDALEAGKSVEEAECLANLALTQGWHDPNGASCELIVKS